MTRGPLRWDPGPDPTTTENDTEGVDTLAPPPQTRRPAGSRPDSRGLVRRGGAARSQDPRDGLRPQGPTGTVVTAGPGGQIRHTNNCNEDAGRNRPERDAVCPAPSPAASEDERPSVPARPRVRRRRPTGSSTGARADRGSSFATLVDRKHDGGTGPRVPSVPTPTPSVPRQDPWSLDSAL